MAVCPVCGCKTDALDFVEKRLNDADCKVCSFCNRQLGVFDTVTEPTEAQLRWLDAVLDTEVAERDENVASALKAIREKFAGNVEEQAAPTPQPKANVVVQQQKPAKKAVAEMPANDVIKELQDRITALENELRAMKRKQMIKTIVEMGAPFVLLIVLLIVVLSSGVIDNFKAIFDMAGIAL